MIAVDREDDDGPQESPEIEALRSTAETYRLDNERLQARVAELEREAAPNDPELKPLRQLCRDEAEYQQARRARRSHKLQVVKVGGGLFAKPAWLDRWRNMIR
jgi:hypothetical protein